MPGSYIAIATRARRSWRRASGRRGAAPSLRSRRPRSEAFHRRRPGVAIEYAFVFPVRRRANDDVGDPGLVLERKEDVSLRCLGMLLHHHGTCDEHVAPV